MLGNVAQRTLQGSPALSGACLHDGNPHRCCTRNNLRKDWPCWQNPVLQTWQLWALGHLDVGYIDALLQFVQHLLLQGGTAGAHLTLQVPHCAHLEGKGVPCAEPWVPHCTPLQGQVAELVQTFTVPTRVRTADIDGLAACALPTQI